MKKPTKKELRELVALCRKVPRERYEAMLKSTDENDRTVAQVVAVANGWKEGRHGR